MINWHRVAPRLSLPALLGILFVAAISVQAQQQQAPPAAEQSADGLSSEVKPASTQDKTSSDQSFQDPKDKPQPQSQTQPQTPTPSQPGESGTSKDRLFFTLPNFLTLENAGNIPPLTAGQKFKVVARSSFDYVQYPWYGFLSGISQAENSEPGYGQGAAGYGKRYGAAFADGTIENFWTAAILPSVLRQDPRYFQNGKGGFWHRTGYAISRIFVIRTDSGKNQFNASEIFGAAIAAGISTYSYHPHDDKTLRNTASVWATQIGYDTISIVVKEFWPDIRRKLKKKKE